MVRRIIGVAVAALAVVPSVVAAQESRVYLGGAAGLVTQTHSAGVAAGPLGGTKPGGSVVVGVRVSPRLAVEFEPSFGQPYSQQYSYRPSPSLIADVVARRRDSFFSFQLRTRAGVLEPVVGVSYIHGKISRHAIFSNGVTYFDDSRTDHGVAAVAGLDAALEVTSHFYFVPTFRLFARVPSSPEDPLGEQTGTGPFAFRYGAGVRVTF